MAAVRNRLFTCALLALALLASAGHGSARAATVSQSGSQITITFGNTGTVPEAVYMYTSGTNWTFTGDTGGAGPIAISGACEIVVNDVGGGTDQELVLGPSTTLTPSACGSSPFKLTTTGLDRLSLSGSINMPLSATSSIAVDAATAITAEFAATIGGPISFQSTINGAHALSLSGTTVSLAGRVGGAAPPASLAATASTAISLGDSVTTTGAQTFSGPISTGTSLTLAAATVSITGDVTGAPGGPRALAVDVTGTSSINGVVSDGGSGAVVSVDKRGAGALTLTGASTYTGATTVTAGTLIANTSGALGSATGSSSVASGARLQFNGIGGNSEPITLAGGSALAAAGGSVSSLAGPVTLQSGAQTLDVAGGATLVLGGGVNGEFIGNGTITATGVGQLTVGSSGIGVTTLIGSFASSSTGRLRVGGNILAAGTVLLDGTVETWTAAATISGTPVSGSGTIDNGNGSSGSTLTLDSGNQPNTLSGAIGSGAGDAAKLNLVLTGASAHTLSATTSGFIGSLTVQAGSLLVSGTISHPSSTTIASGATVAGSGTGTIGSPIAFSSGSSGFGIGAGEPFLLTVGSITSSTVVGYLNVVVDGTTPGTGYTQIVSTGSADLAGFNVWSDGFEAPIGTVITPLTTASGITGPLTGRPEGSYYSYWRISYLANGGRDMTWTFVGAPPGPTAVSPSTSPLAGGGTLTVTGPPLYDGTQVTVGGAPCANPTRISISELTCTLPAHAAGAVDVVVTNGTRSATLAGAITYAESTSPSATTGGSPTTRALVIGTPRLVGRRLVTTITAPSAGTITQTALTGKGRKRTTRCRVRQVVAGATDVTISCALNRKTRAALRRSSLRLTVTTTFTPTDGKATTRVAKVKVKRTTTGKRALPL